MFNAINKIDIYNTLLSITKFYHISNQKLWHDATSYEDKKYLSYTIKKPDICVMSWKNE